MIVILLKHEYYPNLKICETDNETDNETDKETGKF